MVSEACYSSTGVTSGGVTYSSLCPGGADVSTAPGSGLNCDSSVKGCDHGIHVAGIAAGKGSSLSGVAPDAKLIAIQVPTEINALRYIEAQDVAKRKSMAFAGAMGLAIQRNPKFQNAHSVQMTDSTKKAHYQAKEVESES